ncbi:TrkA C-terminal domain-containing protein, partial [Paenibacillus lignilyticus]
LMRATGLNRDISRFQVISLLTSTGYTTKESELISNHPIRRRIGMFLILFGVVSFAVVVSAIASIIAPKFHLVKMGFFAGLLLVLLLILRTPITYRYLASKLSDSMEVQHELHDFPVKDVLFRDSLDVFTEIIICADSPYVGSIAHVIIQPNADLNLLYIRRGADMLRTSRYDTPLKAGDALCFYGREDELKVLFSRELAAAAQESEVYV